MEIRELSKLTIVMTRSKRPLGTEQRSNTFALDRDFHLTLSIELGPASARRSPYTHVNGKVKSKAWQPTYPHYLIAAKVLIPSAKKPIIILQVDKTWVGCFINSPFTIVRLPAIDAKDLQGVVSHPVNQFTSQLSHSLEELHTICQLLGLCGRVTTYLRLECICDPDIWFNTAGIQEVSNIPNR